MIPQGTPVRWCESCSKAEALIKVTEQLPDGLTWVHNWCIECARLKVIEGVDTDLQDVVYFYE